MTTALHSAIARLTTIDWDEPASVLDGCEPLFETAQSDPGFLPSLLDDVAGNEHLAGMCERYDFLDKLVLHDLREQGVRIRLHLYRSGYFDRPHNHRWSFASLIMRGRYRHRIFGRDDAFDESTDPATLVPIHERVERQGDHYVLHHSSVHTVQADADTVSLLVRGPAAKQRFLILDRETNGFFWVYGAADETPEQRASKRMTPVQLEETIRRARALVSGPVARTAR